jgi:transcriptional regulator with XRE-family HTH domain
MEIFTLDREAFPWKLRGMTEAHPLEPFISTTDKAQALAEHARCSVSHLLNIRDGRKSASLALAKRLSDKTGLPMDAFLQPEAAQ